MDYIPTRIMVPLRPKGISQALGKLAEKREQHPRETARELIQEGLEHAGVLCPQCGSVILSGFCQTCHPEFIQTN
jgi:hypothetical protein